MTNNPKIYLISGLGADKRAFRKLVFPNEYQCVYLDWIPMLLDDTLESYAERLSSTINKAEPFYLIGLSFGGMLATGITKVTNPVRTFLISSNAVSSELPWYYKFAGQIKLQKIVPLSLIKTTNSFGLELFGAKTKEEKTLLKQLIFDSDPKFIKWALNCILSWRNKTRPSQLIHIHGTADNILPIKYTKPDYTIEGGSHFMVYAKAAEITTIIVTEIINASNKIT